MKLQKVINQLLKIELQEPPVIIFPKAVRKGQNAITNSKAESRISNRTMYCFLPDSARRQNTRAPVLIANCTRKKRNIRGPCRLYNRACSASKRIRAEKLRDKPVLTEDSPVRIAEPEGNGCMRPAVPKNSEYPKTARMMTRKKRLTRK